MQVRARIYSGAVAEVAMATERLMRDLQTTHEATIGVHEEDGGRPKRAYDGRDGVQALAEVMVRHEYGDAGLPERSFLRTWCDEHIGVLARGMFEARRRELEGDKDAIKNWVAAVHAQWKRWLEDGGDFAPLSPVTIAMKTHYGLPKPDAPLIATEQFVNAWRAKLDGVPV